METLREKEQEGFERAEVRKSPQNDLVRISHQIEHIFQHPIENLKSNWAEIRKSPQIKLGRKSPQIEHNFFQHPIETLISSIFSFEQSPRSTEPRSSDGIPKRDHRAQSPVIEREKEQEGEGRD